MEWDNPKKLCRRDQEIEAIQVKVNIALRELETEKTDMTVQLNKCTERVAGGGSEENQKNLQTV